MELLKARFARLNKNDTLARYEEEVASGDYDTEDVKVEEEITMFPAEYNHFANNLLEDRWFLAGKGGTDSTADVKIDSREDFLALSKEQVEEWRAGAYRLVIAIKCEGRKTLYVDPQGHDYARYVGLPVEVENV